MSEWQPIETAPKETPIVVYGCNVLGQGAAGGPYERWFVTVAELSDIEGWPADDLLNPGCDCVRGGEVEHPTHWMPLPEPPQ